MSADMRTLEDIAAVLTTLCIFGFIVSFPVAFFSGSARWWRTVKLSLGVGTACAAILVVLNILMGG